MSKTFLSIGAGPGIGLATARRFAREGYDIVLSSRSMDRLRKQAGILGADGARVTLAQADAARPGQIHDLVSGVAEQGELVLHYNAGVLHYDAHGKLLAQPIGAQAMVEQMADLQINLASALPAMQARGGGTILLTGGGFGIHPSPDFLTLSVGKAGLRALAMALYEPLKKDNIHIGTVTVSQLVSPDSQASRDIADRFWELHAQSREAWTWETHFG